MRAELTFRTKILGKLKIFVKHKISKIMHQFTLLLNLLSSDCESAV